MAHEPTGISGQEPGSSSKNGLYHCKAGQETIHDIIAKTTELFTQLKTANTALQRTPETEAKKAKIRDALASVQHKFVILRDHYNNVNEICSSLAYVQIKSLIPFKDDPDNVEQIQKHRQNQYVEPSPEIMREKGELLKKIAERDEELHQITNELRDFTYEINTLLHT